MTIDVYTSTGSKKGTATLPKTLFEAPINEGLMHQAVVRQQSNRRSPIAHVKTRGEVQGSTAKLFRQKGTGRARRGSVRAPVLRGGGKAFGPRNNANYYKDMPKKMRQAALRSCLTAQANNNVIIGLESYPDETKTKTAMNMLKKMPVDIGRKILVVLPESQKSVQLAVRNIPNVKTVTADYLNPEDVLGARHIIFHVDAIQKAEELFGSEVRSEKSEVKSAAKKEESPKDTEKASKKATTKKPAAKKSTTKKS